MKVHLASEGTHNKNFIRWLFIGGSLFFLGIIFPGLYSFIVIPIGLLIVLVTIWYFNRFKCIYFNESEIFIGKEFSRYEFTTIQSIQFKEDMLLSGHTYLLTLRTINKTVEVRFFLKYPSEIENFVVRIKACNSTLKLDLKDPLDKLMDAIKNN